MPSEITAPSASSARTFSDDWRFQAAGNLTGVVGRHTMKAGLEFNHVDAARRSVSISSALGISAAPRERRSNDVARWADRQPFRRDERTYQKQLGNLELSLATDELAFFAQDAWRVNNGLTFNYGLRWEGAFNPTPEANNEFMLGAVQGFTFPLGRTVDPTQIPDQLSQFGPRVGFAWDPGANGNTVVRGYTGLYYARTPMLLWAAPMNNFRIPPGDLSVQLPFSAPGNPNNTIDKQMALIGIDLNSISAEQPADPDERADHAGSAGALGLAVNPYLGAQPIVVDQEYKNPRATQAGAGVEREIVSGVTVAADFTYVKTDYLQRNRELNLVVTRPCAR